MWNNSSVSEGTLIGSGYVPGQVQLAYIFQDADLASSSKIVSFLLFTLGISSFFRYVLNALKLSVLYYTVVIICSFFTGFLLKHFSELSPYTLNLLETTNANLYLLIFFPVMLFHTAFSMDYHGFGHSTAQVLILAVIGFPLQSFFLCIIFHAALIAPDKWSLEMTLIFAVICCIIESDLVLNELNKTQARVKHVQLLLQGEQLANLAMATLGYTLIFEHYFGTHNDELFILYTLLWHILGGVLGFILGYSFGYLFTRCYYDMVVAVTLTLFAAFVTFYIGHIHLHQSGVIVTIVTGVLLSPAKIKTTSDVESHLSAFWEWLSYIAHTLSLVLPCLMVGHNPTFINYPNVIFAILVHVICVCTRGFLYVLMRPLLVKVGHFLTWTNIIVIVIGPYRAAPTLIIAMLYRQYTPEIGHLILTLVALLCLFSTFFNGLLLPVVLKLLGMFDLTRARAVNMRNAIALVQESRTKAIHSLKMDRVVADANWLIVDESTRLETHHFQTDEEKGADYGGPEMLERHRAICSDCGLENEVLPTQKEIADLELEGKHRILKAELVSLWRQYETGTLTKRSIRILSTLLQNAMEKPTPWLDVSELELYWSPPKYMDHIKAGLEFILRSLPQKYEHGPLNRVKSALFVFFNNVLYKMFSTLLILVDTYFIVNLALYDHWLKKISIPDDVLQVLDYIFYILFLSEFICLVIVLGLDEYFKRLYHKIDFLCNVLIRSCEILMIIEFYIEKSPTNTVDAVRFPVNGTKLLLLFRLNRLYTVLEVIIWKLLHILEVRLDNTLVQYYDIGKAFLIANDRTLKYLRHIVQDKTVYTKLRRELEEDKKRVAKSVGIIQKERPNVAVTLKTHHAIKHVINEMMDSINVIYDEGLLDEIERKSLQASLENTKKNTRNLEVITPRNPEQILADVPWLYGEEATAEYLLKHARMHSYAYEDVILGAGDDPFGVFVIVSGLVKCSYRPCRATIENCRKHGALPNCDFRVSLKLEEMEEDYIVCGNVIGEIGAVTGRKLDMTVICQSEVQAYYIPRKYMWNVLFEFENSVNLFTNVWKSIGIRIALLILQYVPNFQGWLKEKTLLYLERSFVPILSGVEELFINDLVSDVILIEGMVMDGNTRSMFFAPYYIPRTTNKLVLPGTNKWSIDPKYETRLLVIPTEHSEETEIMGPNGIIRNILSAESFHHPSGRNSSFLKRHKSTSTLRREFYEYRRRRLKFHKQLMRQLLAPGDSGESTETYSTDSDIPLMQIFQRHVKTAVKQKPENRINLQNEFNFVEDVSEESDIEENREMTDYSSYGKLLRKKIKKKIMKRVKLMTDASTQTNYRAFSGPSS